MSIIKYMDLLLACLISMGAINETWPIFQLNTSWKASKRHLVQATKNNYANNFVFALIPEPGNCLKDRFETRYMHKKIL